MLLVFDGPASLSLSFFVLLAPLRNPLVNRLIEALVVNVGASASSSLALSLVVRVDLVAASFLILLLDSPDVVRAGIVGGDDHLAGSAMNLQK